MSKIVSSAHVGIYMCNTDDACCFCDAPLEQGSPVKQVAKQFACMACVDKSLKWMLAKRAAKKILESQGVECLDKN